MHAHQSVNLKKVFSAVFWKAIKDYGTGAILKCCGPICPEVSSKDKHLLLYCFLTFPTMLGNPLVRGGFTAEMQGIFLANLLTRESGWMTNGAETHGVRRSWHDEECHPM